MHGALAGGDRSLAVVAAAAETHGLPFMCIPGTRNHFVLDVAVDRRDLVGALDAFTDRMERRIDVPEVNGQRVVQADAGSQLHTRLSAGHAAAALVRPDHTVIQAGRDVSALCLAAPRFLADADVGA